MENKTKEFAISNDMGVERKPYQTPTLRLLGDVQSVVLGGAAGGSDGAHSSS